jgi:hypothetical protein
MAEPGIVEFRDGDCAYVGDERHFPLALTTWWGEPTEKMMRSYFAWAAGLIARAAASDLYVIFVSDSRFTTRPPATVRKVAADLANAMPHSERTLQSFVVLDSALIRGAITALQWLSSRDLNLTMVGTVERAITSALELFATRGITLARSIDPAAYPTAVMPGPDVSKAG